MAQKLLSSQYSPLLFKNLYLRSWINHDIIALFKIYRAVSWNMQVKINQVKHRFTLEYGTDVDSLDFVWAKAKENSTKEKAIFIDEVWKLLSTNDMAATYVLEIFKTSLEREF